MIDLMAYRDPQFPADQPETLVLMLAVQEFPIEPDPCPAEEIKLRGLRNTWANNYVKFKKDMEEFEKAWLQFKALKLGLAPSGPAASETRWNGTDPCPTCKREPDDHDTLSQIEMAKKWLREHGDE